MKLGVGKLSFHQMASADLEKVTFELRPEYTDRYLDEEHSTQKKEKAKA